ncbi:aminotransferase class I/II-fold pyridoxal phosphate-dependent enzyme [Robiginitalea sp. M366]|uniref:aminotransferase class I/II-fold pyridoxal phosphate-dependent enzyme n=1 Tax=Robiginitalea aestuariiviva TaxID=3036903 RepID=UPI00240DFDEE|nr:aminotransferase class I/II-fold pyridoxal phosphate-dependent enzyme [Robiginitalea aestuariiviva]MDG1573389.1 aminotransferase class I/II-fold pyridoxal phosphate-dependent enzyme [Robiginitalea aestuariiviva]
MILELPHIPGPEFRHQGTDYLYFGGTAYLGIQQSQDFRTLLAAAVQAHGSHWGASRLGNIRLQVYREAETRLAALAAAPAACTVSSGYLAARLVSEYFLGLGHPCFYAPGCHAALIPPGKQREADWENLAVRFGAAQEQERPPVLFADALEVTDRPRHLKEILEGFAARRGILVADDSHGLGLIGSNGFGTYTALEGMGFRETLVCASMGKAMGITAGLVLGPAHRLQTLQDSEIFSGASPAPPASLAAFLEAEAAGLYTRQQKALQDLLSLVEPKTLPPGMGYKAGYPVLAFQNPALAAYLFAQNVLITHFEYPADGTPASPSRIVLTAAHQPVHLERLSGLLRKFNKTQA